MRHTGLSARVKIKLGQVIKSQRAETQAPSVVFVFVTISHTWNIFVCTQTLGLIASWIFAHCVSTLGYFRAVKSYCVCVLKIFGFKDMI